MKINRYSFYTPNGLINGLWACQRAYISDYTQCYPKDFLKRVYELLEINPEKHLICHLFSGYIKGLFTVDLNPKSNANFKEDATHTHFKKNSFDLVLADPPYNEKYAKVWNLKLPKIRDIIKEMHRLTKINGYYGLLHFIIPRDDFKERIAVIAITEGANMNIRALTLFQKRVDKNG